MTDPTRDDVDAIRQLLDGWANAVRRGELDGVLAGHDEDIVMFDVPPPAHGVRGRDAEHCPRLTIGLEKRDGRWTVVHEHHSFPELD